MLDLVDRGREGLDADLGLADRRKLDEYLTGVREIEKPHAGPPAPARGLPRALCDGRRRSGRPAAPPNSASTSGSWAT